MIDVEQHTLFDHVGEKVTLTSMEFDLRYALMPHPRRALSRDQLLNLAHHARSARLIDRRSYHEIAQENRNRSRKAACSENGSRVGPHAHLDGD